MPTLLAVPELLAQITADSEAVTKLIAIVATVVGAILVGLVLYHFSQRSSQEQYRGGGPAPAARPDVPQFEDPKLLAPTILEQLAQLGGSTTVRERVARTVTDIVQKTLDGQVETVKRQLDDRYGQVIEEHRRAKAVLEQKYQATLSEHKQTSAVLGSIAEGLVVVNNKGEVVMMNPAAERLLAVKQEDRIGQPLTRQLQEGQLVSLVSGDKGTDREIVVNAKDDATRRILRASNAVITDENGATVGMVAVLSDITKQRELDQMKTDFLARVSHELRTPIVAMQHALAIITDQLAGPVTDDQKKFIDVTQRNLQRLNGLINDLLDLSKLEAKRMDLHVQRASLAELIHTVCETLGPWAESKALALAKRLPDVLPEAEFDAARITQVLINLIGNAIKFTPRQGRITIEAKVVPEGDALEVSVADTGVGIAPEDLPKLFSKFQQVGDRMASDIGGTGLGLAIAKEIVELHHGRIWAESSPQGTRFSFTLPLVHRREAATT